jgi:hypothetical protein
MNLKAWVHGFASPAKIRLFIILESTVNRSLDSEKYFLIKFCNYSAYRQPKATWPAGLAV